MASGRSHSSLRHDIDATHEHEYGYHPSNPTQVHEIETVARGDSFQNQNRNHVVPVTEGDEGASLTWKDLWVTIQGRTCRSILQGLTGYATPGQLLAIMGPSGCGKSTLLDALAGRLSSNTRQTGEILINGHKQALAYGTSAYVTQDDAIITTLTVEEAVYYSAQLQLPDSMSKSEKKERALATIREMGLQDAVNTRIGGWGDKGLSGGQKRRVTICIELLTRPKLLFLDEPTSGLDSAASYYVMSRIANLGHISSPRTIIASIHQPSSEVFQLFDNLCLLSSGKTVYFGPASAANEFFASSGFPCPTLQNPSDHFLKTINKDFDQDIEQGKAGITTTEEAIGTLINSYKSSESYHQLQRHIAELHKKDCEPLERRSHAGFLTQCSVLTRRSSVNMYRDRGYYWLRLIIYIGIALGLGIVFHDPGHTYGSIRARGSMLMFVASFLTFMAIGGFPSFVEDMKVFQRERLNGHYGVSAFVFGNTFSSVPFLMLISLIPGATAYYVTGLRSGFEHFLYFACALFACMMLVESLMMIVASIVPTFLMGIIAGAGIQGVMMLCGGFFQLPNDLPDVVFKYPLYYISFHKYAFQGMYKNEFAGTRYPNDNQLGMSSSEWLSGERILKDIWQLETGYSKWVDLAILLGMVVLYRVLFFVFIKTAEKMKTITSFVLSVAPKRSTQVLVNPPSTPLHGDSAYNNAREQN
ncbi:putative taurine-transporting ATPase [Rosa chinensis]|uniref:Putative taurine-transporting ATPase n=1 Tax=Rosa chinensis TaxID=74649 RepID=A0A2P6S0L5_ROSCH|nr:ABC transporter G family member 1 [Rosa chinensis]PRQ52220.1 putative taurine-transporting ATPase [Rosa chinensis]